MNIFNNLLFQYYIGKSKKEMEGIKKLSGKDREKKIKNILEKKYGEDPKNATKAGLIGTIVEEGSHVIGKVESRQRETGTDEKGLESTGRASNEYFLKNTKMIIQISVSSRMGRIIPMLILGRMWVILQLQMMHLL